MKNNDIIWARVYYISDFLDNLDDSQRQLMLSLVCDYRRGHVESMKSKRGYDVRLISGFLLEKNLREYEAVINGRVVADFDMSKDENGKPYLTDYPYEDAPYFNISHAGDWVLVTVSNKPVGGDIEGEGKCNAKIAERCFSKEDNELLNRIASDWEVSRKYGLTINQAYTLFWTMKEAYIKYTGLGLSQGLGTFTIDLDSNKVKDDDYGEYTWTFIENDTMGMSIYGAKDAELNYLEVTEWGI